MLEKALEKAKKKKKIENRRKKDRAFGARAGTRQSTTIGMAIVGAKVCW